MSILMPGKAFGKDNKKVVLSLSGDQDDTYARYIKPFWPELRQMEMGGMTVGLAYNAQLRASKETRFLFSGMDAGEYP